MRRSFEQMCIWNSRDYVGRMYKLFDDCMQHLDEVLNISAMLNAFVDRRSDIIGSHAVIRSFIPAVYIRVSLIILW